MKVQKKIRKEMICPISLIIILFLLPHLLFAGGSEEKSMDEAASSTGRGKYLAGQGIIIPPDEVHINSYIASIDYNYPNPEDALGVDLYSGHYQISTTGKLTVVESLISEFDDVYENRDKLLQCLLTDQNILLLTLNAGLSTHHSLPG